MNMIAATARHFTVATSLFVVATASADEGFVSMFDGQSLTGWVVSPDSASGAWSVQDGLIAGDGDKGRSYLVYETQDIANFEMKLSYRFPGKGNSGISIRARKDDTGRRTFQSYHADFGHLGIGKTVLGAWDFHTPGRKEHRCFRGDRLVIDQNDKPAITAINDALTVSDICKGGWNDVHIIACDNRFTFYINGRLASEFVEYLPQEQRLQKGMIQLQLHDPGMTVQFKDLHLKILN